MTPHPFTIATWNVNSLRVRMDRLLGWLGRVGPDVLCLQETKCEDEKFPALELKAAGYESAHHGQRTYNGVAILSKHPLEDVRAGLGDEEGDDQCRLIAATVRGVRVLSAYIPNGQALDSPKYAYKLRWIERLRAHLDRDYHPAAPLALCGDYNIAPDERDVHDSDLWAQSTLFHEDVREALARLAAFGLTDSFRTQHQEGGLYSWWDYRMLGFPKNRGLRIDHIFVTPPLAARCVDARIDREERKGKQPSDHAPVIATFDL